MANIEIKGLDDTVEWYDQNAEEYAKNQGKHIPLEAIEWFLKALPENPDILEAGCGPGRESAVFLEKGAKPVGVDLSEGLLNIAQEKNPSVEYIKGSFLDVPLPDGTFDGVWAHASLVHLESLEDAQKALNEFSRVLKPEGVLFVGVKLQVGDQETEVIADSLSKHERFFRYYSEDTVDKFITSSGLTLIDTHHSEDKYGRSEVKWGWFLARKDSQL